MLVQETSSKRWNWGGVPIPILAISRPDRSDQDQAAIQDSLFARSCPQACLLPSHEHPPPISCSAPTNCTKKWPETSHISVLHHPCKNKIPLPNGRGI